MWGQKSTMGFGQLWDLYMFGVFWEAQRPRSTYQVRCRLKWINIFCYKASPNGGLEFFVDVQLNKVAILKCLSILTCLSFSKMSIQKVDFIIIKR